MHLCLTCLNWRTREAFVTFRENLVDGLWFIWDSIVYTLGDL